MLMAEGPGKLLHRKNSLLKVWGAEIWLWVRCTHNYLGTRNRDSAPYILPFFLSTPGRNNLVSLEPLGLALSCHYLCLALGARPGAGLAVPHWHPVVEHSTKSPRDQKHLYGQLSGEVNI